MKEIEYTPNACKEGGFSGTVKLRMPLFDERYEALDKMGLKVKEDGNIDASSIGSFDSVRMLVNISEKFYKEVKLKHEDGREFNSLDDLKSDPDCDPILIEIAMGVSRGFRPTKN